MKLNRTFTILIIFANIKIFAQIPNLPTSQQPNPANIFTLPKIGTQLENKNIPAIPSDWNNTQTSNAEMQNRKMIAEDFKKVEKERQETTQRKYLEKLEEDYRKIYSLTSYSDKAGSQSYYSAFQNLSKLNPENYSITDATFIVENAFFNDDKNFANTYQSSIQKATKSIRNQLTKNGINDEDNTSKNLEIFEYFSKDTKENGKIVKKAFKYDFDDYFGEKDYSKMFVSKLMKTGSGQCHSMPLLYLILAEQLGVDASLVMSPNHSYIRFMDENGDQQSIELTNGMFSTDTFVLNSGYIKSEALQNKIYMQNLTKKDILSQTFVDLASGYIHKFGYDEFSANVIDKALELNPNNIFAKLWKSNTDQKRFLQASERQGINPNDKTDLQKIKDFPELAYQLNQINNGFDEIDNSGFTLMSAEDYQKWLGSLSNAENKQKSEEIAERMKAINAQKKKEALQKQKLQQAKKPIIKKESPKYYTIPKELL